MELFYVNIKHRWRVWLYLVKLVDIAVTSNIVTTSNREISIFLDFSLANVANDAHQIRDGLIFMRV